MNTCICFSLHLLFSLLAELIYFRLAKFPIEITAPRRDNK